MPKPQATTAGTLYIVATPIGNSEDLTFRALQVLKMVDNIIAEDTRHSLPFLKAFGIQKPLLSLHAFNENAKSEEVIAALLQGKSFALISDAGTPLICDPGFPLVKAARNLDIPVVPIPGACALTTALSAAGIASDVFTFGGFLPAKQAARCAALQDFKQNIFHTLVFYESPHRVVACLNDMLAVFGEDTELVLAKELTKTFERFVSGKIAVVKEWLLSSSSHVKGEFVLLVAPRPQVTKNEAADILPILLEALPLKKAVEVAALITKENKNAIYALALQFKSQREDS